MKKIRALFNLPKNIGIYDLEVSRIVFYGMVLFLYSQFNFFQYSDQLINLYDPDYFFKWLSIPFPDGIWIYNLRNVWYLFLFFSMIGFCTRISIWISFTLGFYILGLPWYLGALVHQTQCVVICMGIFCFSKCGKSISIDSYLKKVSFWSENKVEKFLGDSTLTEEEWVIRTLQFNWCLLFFNAGLAKIKNIDLGIFSVENFQNILVATSWRLNTPDTMLRLFLNQHPSLGVFLFGLVALLEFVCIGVIFYNERFKWFIIFTLIFMQFGAYYLVGVDFLLMAPIYIFWVPWTKLFWNIKSFAIR